MSSSMSHVFLKLTAGPILVFPLVCRFKLGYYAGGGGGKWEYCEVKFWCKLTWRVHFSSDISLAQSYFEKSLILRT